MFDGEALSRGASFGVRRKRLARRAHRSPWGSTATTSRPASMPTVCSRPKSPPSAPPTIPPSSPPSPSLPPLPPLPGYCVATSAVASKAVVVPKIVGPKIVGGVPVDPARKYVPDPPSRANAALRSPPAAVC